MAHQETAQAQKRHTHKTTQGAKRHNHKTAQSQNGTRHKMAHGTKLYKAQNGTRHKLFIVSPLCCDVYLENIGFVYPTMSMVVIGPSLLY
jgi:hypothetical protein